MTVLLLVPALGTDAAAWLAPLLAAASGIVLHVLLPPQDPAAAEALLIATVHP